MVISQPIEHTEDQFFLDTAEDQLTERYPLQEHSKGHFCGLRA